MGFNNYAKDTCYVGQRRRSGGAKLSVDQIDAIRDAPKSVSHVSLAKFYGSARS